MIDMVRFDNAVRIAKNQVSGEVCYHGADVTELARVFLALVLEETSPAEKKTGTNP